MHTRIQKKTINMSCDMMIIQNHFLIRSRIGENDEEEKKEIERKK